MDDRTLAQIAPSGDFGNTFTINCDNPLMSAQQLANICTADNLRSSASSATSRSRTARRSTTAASTELRGWCTLRSTSSMRAATPTTRRSSSFSVATRKAEPRHCGPSSPGVARRSRHARRSEQRVLVRRYFQYGRTNYHAGLQERVLGCAHEPCAQRRERRSRRARWFRSGRLAPASSAARCSTEHDPNCVP